MKGGARSAVWRQIHADVTGHSHQTLDVDEGPALGAALLAAVGTGAFPTVADACRVAIRPVANTRPNATDSAVYAKFYPIYRRLYAVLKEQFAADSAAVG